MMMKYAEIMKALPKDVADLLQSKLDAVQLPPDITPAEAEELLQDAVDLTRLEMVIHDDEKRRLVDTILTFAAKAGVQAIFG